MHTIVNDSTFKELSNYQIECNGSASAPLSDDHKHQIREQKWGDTLISLNLRQNRFRFFGLRRAFCCQRLFKKIFYPAMASAGATPSMDPLAPGGPKFFGRGGSCCRHYWIKYSHKHAKLTEKKYLLSR